MLVKSETWALKLLTERWQGGKIVSKNRDWSREMASRMVCEKEKSDIQKRL